MPVSLESALFQRLNGLAGLISFQSTVKSGKVKVPVYPGVMPDTDETGLRTDLPAIVFQRYSTRALSSFGVDHQLYAFGVQLDIYAKSYADVRGISDVVQDSLQRYQGGSFSDVFLNDVFDDYEEEDRTYRVVHDYTIWASNLSPVLDTVLNDLDVYVKFDQMLDLTGSFSDPEGDAVSYDVVSRNTARVQVSISGNTATIKAVEAGYAVPITVSAMDTQGASGSADFTVNTKARLSSYAWRSRVISPLGGGGTKLKIYAYDDTVPLGQGLGAVAKTVWDQITQIPMGATFTFSDDYGNSYPGMYTVTANAPLLDSLADIEITPVVPALPIAVNVLNLQFDSAY